MRIGTEIAIIVALAFLGACGKSPDPVPGPGPVPDTKTTFQIENSKIVIRGEMKPGAKVSMGEIKAAVLTTVKHLESK